MSIKGRIESILSAYPRCSLLLVVVVLIISSLSYAQTLGDYNLLIVDGYGSANTKVEVEAMGHNATIFEAETLTPGFDFSTFDAVLFMYNANAPAAMAEILDLNSNNYLGIILMRGTNVVSICDVGTSSTWSDSEFIIENNNHFITEPFTSGMLNLGFTYKTNLESVNSGHSILGSVSSGNGSLVVSDTRRIVVSPYYGHTSGMPWNSDAATLLDRIIAWASSRESLSIDNPSEEPKIKIGPNPATDHIKVSGLKKPIPYHVYNMLGGQVEQGTISNDKHISIEGYKSGLYLLQLNHSNTFKFLKE